MRDSIFALAASAALAGAALLAQTQDDVEMAIKLGQSGKASQLVSSCLATPSFGQSMGTIMRSGPTPVGAYRVYLATNIGKIATLANEAKVKYMPYAKADVPADLLEPSVHVWIVPDEPKRSDHIVKVASPLKHLVLKAKSREEAVVQPEKLETTPVEWQIIVGKFEGTKAQATFALNAVRALPAGDFDVVLITEAGERRCRVGQGDRRRLGL